MNRQQLTLIVSCALLLSGAGAFAATFTVPAPTANPAADTAAIQSAINSAVASADPTNFVQLQSGATYVLDTTLAIAGSPVNVTFTTTGAQPATLVGAPTPTRTLAANAGQGGDLGTFSVNVRNGRLGWENLILLPAPLSTLGVSSKAGQSAIAAYPGTATTTFTLSNVLITGNNNSNQPVSTDGSIDPTTVPNYTVWGENGVRITSSSAVAGYGGLTSSNVVYMKDAVVSGCKYGFYSKAT
ncbi:hypothetical protein HS125_17305 [bacterium]|nr:hypothetical protein [bacterium]